MQSTLLLCVLLLPLAANAFQVISSGTTVNLPANTTTYLCININQTLVLETVMYPIHDFGKLNETSMEIIPLEIPVVVVGNYSQFCGNVSESGMYYAILRASSTTFVSTTVESTTTSTVESTTAVPVLELETGQLSVVGWIGIAVGCLTIVTIFILLVCMATRSYKIVVNDEPIERRLVPKSKVHRRIRHGFKQ